MGRSSSRSSSREDKKKRKRDKDDKKKKKSRSRSTKKDSKRKRSTSRDKKKKHRGDSNEHKKKRSSRSRDKKNRSHSRDKKKRRDRSDSKKKQVSKEKSKSAEKTQPEKPVELTEQEKEQRENQKKRERLARMKMMKFASLDDSDDDDDQPLPKPTNNQTQVVQQSNQTLPKESAINPVESTAQYNDNSENGQYAESSEMQPEDDLLMLQMKQQIAAQALLQQSKAENNQSSQQRQSYTRGQGFAQTGQEEEMILEKESLNVEENNNRYLEDYLNDNDVEEENEQGYNNGENAANMEEKEYYNQQDEAYSDDLQFDDSDNENGDLEQNGKQNRNNHQFSEKLQKLQMMNQQKDDAEEDEGLLGVIKPQPKHKMGGHVSNNAFSLPNGRVPQASNSTQNSTSQVNKPQLTSSTTAITNTLTKTLDIPTAQSMNTSNFSNNKTIIQQQQVDEDQESDESDLDVYMRQLEEEENAKRGLTTKQNTDNTNASKQNFITMEEIFGKKTFKEDEEIDEENQENNNGQYQTAFGDVNNEEDNDDQDDEEAELHYQAFKEEMRKIKEEKKRDTTGALMMDEEQDGEEEVETFVDPENGESKEEYNERMKRLALKKELKPIEYTEEDLEPFQKEFYRESTEVALMTPEEVKTYRENLGDIAVKGHEVQKPIRSWLQSGLSDRILDVLLVKKKYDKPFPIQCQSLPVIMSGRDMIDFLCDKDNQSFERKGSKQNG